MEFSTNEQILSVLQHGNIQPKGKLLWGSNYTYLVEVETQDEGLLAIYKPIRGERPLWDFPSTTLAGREVAAYLASEALGWSLVPPTIYRETGPQGPGSLQLFIDHDPEYHYFNFSDADRERLRPVVLFDLLINNADRKGSHVLVGQDKTLWLIDHGICFHAEYKLRTVIWDFAGEAIPTHLCESLLNFLDMLKPEQEFSQSMQAYLSSHELYALARRTEQILSDGHFPDPKPNFRPYPWPPV